MTYDEALNYINDFTWSTSRLGLDRTRELLERLDNPQRKLKFIHVAGTNGKGSTCAMLASILREAGLRAGLYPSPYLEDFRERIEVNGEMISKEELADITEAVRKEADSMADHPSQFELITAIGMLYYVRKKCDIVVLEVGMGGELDSTNVIDAPEVAVITNIGLDHTEYLGDTLEKIAATKAGIIKKGCDAVIYDNVPSVMDVIRKKCSTEGVRLYPTDGIIRAMSHSLSGQIFSYAGESYELSLLGEHQLKNAAVVLKTVEALRKRGWSISEEAVHRGLKNVIWKARFEVLSEEPLFILDGGHNPQCAEALAKNIEEYIYDEKEGEGEDTKQGKCSRRDSVTFIIGMLKDKDYSKTLDILSPYGRNYVCITPDSPRALSGRKLAETIADKITQRNSEANKRACEDTEKIGIVTANNIPEAIETALSYRFPVVAFGSLYSAGEVRKAYLRKSLSCMM